MTMTPMLDRTPAAPIPFPTISRFEAPARFDVHEISNFDAWVADARAAGITRLVVDCSQITFLDVAAVEAIDAAASDIRTHGSLALTDLSPAATLTFELLGAAAGGREGQAA